MKQKFFFLLLLLSLYIVNCTLTIEAQATIRYVSKTGSSQFPYTSWATAADSIQKCINICSFGDTVYVANGTYQEKIIMIPGLSLVGAGMDSCIIDTRTFPNSQAVNVKSNCLLKHFKIQAQEIYQVEYQGIVISGLNSIVEYNEIRNASLFGIWCYNSNVIIRHNRLINCYKGIYIEFNQPTIDSNYIYRDIEIGDGIIMNLDSSPKIRGNFLVIDNIGIHGISSVFNYSANIVNNNIIQLNNYNSNNKGIYSYNDTLNNNIIFGDWYFGILSSSSNIKNNHIEKTKTAIRYDVGSGGIAPIVGYNNLWQNQINYQNMVGDSTNIYRDPMFFNEDSSDFHLQKYSPLIDAGDPNILDKDSSRSDIGLYGGPFGESYKYLDLAPRSPINLTALVDTNYITLNWNRNTEADTSFYNVYRDTVINFTIDSTKLVSSSSDTFYVQINPHNVTKYVYKVTCVDKQGNESEPSEEKVVNITSVSVDDYPMTISDYRLYQNFPNPFNPSTTISYRLKERGYVKLYVYDIKGELVSVLVNQTQDAGFYKVDFTTDNRQLTTYNLASGIYIYQIHVTGENNIPAFTDIKKMIM
jgi:hypothetical protein